MLLNAEKEKCVCVCVRWGGGVVLAHHVFTDSIEACCWQSGRFHINDAISSPAFQ